MNRKSGLNKTVFFSAAAVVALFTAGNVSAQEKRTVFTENNFQWQANLAPGKTLEVIGRNGDIDATASANASAQVTATRKGSSDTPEAYIEVVEYADGVTICAVYAKDAVPGRCHKGGVDSPSHWGNNHTKITFSVKAPQGVVLKAETTNGSIHASSLKSVVWAATTNGSLDLSTTEWASGATTNGNVDVSMGKANWTGELKLASTNGGISVSLPSSAQFAVQASTTNGNVHTDFPITVQGNFGSKSVSGTVGSGGRELHLATTNGGIELKKSGS